MDDILSRFSINCHSSIRYAGAMTVWFDPFRVADAPCDADVVFVTHDHYDHFSPEDIRRVMKPDAVLVLPETCVAAALRAGFVSAQLLPVRPGEAYTVKDLPLNRRVGICFLPVLLALSPRSKSGYFSTI